MFPIQSTTEDSSKLYVDDVFSTYLRTGTGADVTVTTNIDMTKGYMLWSKSRSAATDHAVYDSARGVTYDLVTNSAAAQTTQSTGLKAVSSTGHTIGSLAKMNTSGATYVDWVFRKSPKFFDVVTYTGNGVAGRQIPHSLGVTPGMIIVKSTSQSGSYWFVWHRSAGGDGVTQTNFAYLNDTRAFSTSSAFMPVAPTDSYFTLTANEGFAPTYTIPGPNTNGATYVAYLFAHDPSADGIIQCGSFTTDGSGNATVNLGWEPQFLLHKSSSGTGSWVLRDVMRGMDVTAGGANLTANTSNAESNEGATNYIYPTATGFGVHNWSASNTSIYLAIRRPNKPPTTGTQVYNATLDGINTDINVGFPVDMSIHPQRGGDAMNGWYIYDRLRGGSAIGLQTAKAYADSINSQLLIKYDRQNIFRQEAGTCNLNWFFRRAPGFFDVVCYTGTGGSKTIPHSLSAAPELMIVKSRGAAGAWGVYSKDVGADKYLQLNAIYTPASDTCWQNTHPTASNFYISNGSSYFPNDSAVTFVAYLFATLPGISKVGSYTGNGSSQTINCGFAAGARFILVKRTDAAGDWYVWDSARGIVAANDPHLSLNTTAAEVTTDDSVDPDNSGFIVNQNSATNINVNGASYIFLSVA